MIVPYIVESDAQASALTQSLGERYELLQVPGNPVPAPTVMPSQPAKP
jgi:hypothetical protein